MKKIAFSLERCRTQWKLRSHAAWEANTKMLPMQHGNAKTDIFDRYFRHLPSENADLNNDQILVVVNFD